MARKNTLQAHERRTRALMTAPMAAFGVLLVALPLIYVLCTSLVTGGKFQFGMPLTLANYKALLREDYLKVFANSLQLAFFTTVISLLVGYPFGYCMARAPRKWKALLMMLVIIPFWTSALVRIYGWKILLQANGPVNGVLRSLGLIQKNIKFLGLHFHIGSQILDMGDFEALCNRINELQNQLEAHHIEVKNINVGGGLGIDYKHPNRVPIPDFKSYFDTYAKHLKLRDGQKVHFELGRAVVGQMGSLITRTLYVKQGTAKQFAIVDAGMTDLIRPALYQAYHKIENITSEEPVETYDVVGPICESSDVFAKAIDLNKTHRGDLIALRSAGAYGEIMASQYNCRQLPKGYTTEEM